MATFRICPEWLELDCGDGHAPLDGSSMPSNPAVAAVGNFALQRGAGRRKLAAPAQ
jgi:hypothetical protein